ncbi:hypothetical protein OHA98_39365 [Streptomyces sp. NBC_00654]|uniref:hypothetical protein n=1 Tax=Streptomyces sp. NBC_00654 TaxID=2975799 RepID=UPI002250FA2A|nr:hypothetical protein [Streptomyces sp. NBC_00654]MCX4970712.1 hypothetical protein [Streptomyces sp. NBC_00654]
MSRQSQFEQLVVLVAGGAAVRDHLCVERELSLLDQPVGRDRCQAQNTSGCTMGAVPPVSFSSELVLVADADFLSAHEGIAFNAGDLDRSIVMAVKDYVRVADPVVASPTADR